MRMKALTKSLLSLIFIAILFGNTSAWSWGINDQQYLIEELVTFNGSGQCLLDPSMEYKQNRYLNHGPITDLFPGGDTDYVIPNQYIMTCGETTFTEWVDYSVSGNGSMTFTFDDGTMDGAVSTDANTIIYTQQECDNGDAYCNMSIGVGIERGNDMAIGDLDGDFAVYFFERGFYGGETGWSWGMNGKQSLVQSEINFDYSIGYFTQNSTEFRQNKEISEVQINVGSGTTDYALVNQYSISYAPTAISGETGLYSIDTNGKITLNFDDGPMYGYLSDNKNVVIFSEAECDDDETACSMGLGVGVRRGSGMERSNLDGTFTVFEFESGFYIGGGGSVMGLNDQHYLIQTDITFDSGTGIYTINSTTETEHTHQLVDGPIVDLISGPDQDYGIPVQHNTHCTQLTESGETGTYEVSSNGTVTLYFDDGDSITGVLCTDGNVLILSSNECADVFQNCSMSIGVGVKQGTGMDEGSLNGPYIAASYESGFNGRDPSEIPAINPSVLQLLLLQ